ncbi:MULTISPECIES: hypothetical protein [Corynebacterium]|uniref:hypothetical protein n=1 Tax=Corynebacterium TaxID=1716 RepID=UPI001F27F171|nr:MULTISPECIES: hypothetical protein [Corynebacterium]
MLVDAPRDTSYNEHTGTFNFGAETLRVVSDNPADVRAVASDGRVFRLVKRSVTVSRYEAICDGRRYLARRTGRNLLEKRRTVTDERGALVATTIGLPNGNLRVVPEGAEGTEGEITLDLAFISWALTLIDAPTRRTLY